MIEGTIDCSEARSRFGGYLAGAESSEAAIELETHLDDCIDCRMAFEHRRESQLALQAKERSAIDFERISQEAEALQTRSIASALRKQSLQQLLKAPVVEPEPVAEECSPVEQEFVTEVTEESSSEKCVAGPSPYVPSRTRWKPLGYSFALLTVLAAAIFVSANSGTIFESPSPSREPGEVAAANASPTPDTPVDPPVAPISAPTPTEGEVAGQTIGSDSGLSIVTAKPIEAPTLQRPVRARGKVRRKAVRTRRTTNRRTRTAPQGVRVYNP